MKNVARIGLAATASLLLYACGSNPAPTDTTAAAATDAQFDQAAVNAALGDSSGEVSVSDSQLQAQNYGYRRDFEVTKTAQGYNYRKVEYDWTLEKKVNKNYVELYKHDKEVLKYKLIFNKNVAKEEMATGVKGQICVKNNTDYHRYAFIKDTVLLEKKHPYYYVIVKVVLNDGKPVKLEAHKNNCFDYDIKLDKKFEGYKFLNEAKVVIPEKKHDKYYYERVEYAYAWFNIPKQTVIKIDDYAYLKDYLTCTEGLKCKLVKDDNNYGDEDMNDNEIYQDFGKVTDSGYVQYYVKVRADNKYNDDDNEYGDDKNGGGHDYNKYYDEYVKNTAKLIEGDTKQERTASQVVKVRVFVKKGDWGHY